MTDLEAPGEHRAELHPFSAFMAARGDGPDPRLAAALSQPGHSAGPASGEPEPAHNVVHIDFRLKSQGKGAEDAPATARPDRTR